MAFYNGKPEIFTSRVERKHVKMGHQVKLQICSAEAFLTNFVLISSN
jgi:hypothetical protein